MAAMHDELVLAGVLDQAGVDELAHHVCGESASLDVLGQLHHLLLEGMDLRILGLLLCLLLSSGLLVGLDLRLGAAPLGADLQHVGGHALGHWMKNEMSERGVKAGTYVRHVWMLRTSQLGQDPWRS